MSHHYTRRSQPNLGREDQITSPDQLHEGLHIGVVSVLEPTTRPMRAARALAALTFAYGRREGETRLTAARNGWQFKDPNGLLPQWHGLVSSVGRQGVWIDLIGHGSGADNPLDYLNLDLQELPNVSGPVRLHSPFKMMGLLAIAANDEVHGDEAGRWMPSATVLLG